MKQHDIYILEGQQIIFDKEYLRGIPEFRVILERRVFIPGDSQGVKKRHNWQLFMYIKIVADLFSYPNKGGWSDEEVHKAAIKESELEDKYKPDDEVRAAIVKFREIQLALLPTLNTIRTSLRGLRTSDMICQGIINNMEKRLALYNKRQSDDLDKGIVLNAGDDKALLDGLLGDLKNIQSVSKSLPDTVSLLEKLEEKVRMEGANEIVGRGRRTIGNRADPKKV